MTESDAKHPDSNSCGLGPYRLAQLKRDMALTPEQRVIEAEETLRLSNLIAPEIPRGSMGFDSYEKFLDWKESRDIAPADERISQRK